MRWFDRLDSMSYRIKMPLGFALAATMAAFIVAVGLTYGAYKDSERALASRAQHLAETAAKALPGLVLKDELWSAFELVRGFAATASGNAADVMIVVVDAQNRVFVSNDPDTYPVGVRFSLAAASESIWRDAPLMSNDDDRIGVVHAGIRRPVLWHEFLARTRSVGMWALIALALLVPLGWLVGNRMAKPLVELADALPQVGANPGLPRKVPEHAAMDEVGLVTRRFNDMTRELAQSELLKREVFRAERLAAVGRLAGGVAHEINNPLAGLLNAIDTQRRHGARDAPLADRTLDLLERGLNQIQQTVAALLVEVRAGGDRLSPADFQDLMTLVEPGRSQKGVSIEWDVRLDCPVPLPAAQVRQVALNLLLNAIDASPRGGRVQSTAYVEDGVLRLTVTDDGAGFSPEEFQRVFEPHESSTHGGEGLGLWVTHQLVQELNGQIEVMRSDGRTSFVVNVPVVQGELHEPAHLSH